MEGIYGCLERIETGIIELQKFKQSDSSSVNDNSANDKLVQDLKVLINENNKQGFEYTEAKIKKFAAAVVQDLNILNNNVKDAKSVIVKAQPSTEILNSLNEIKTSQEQKTHCNAGNRRVPHGGSALFHIHRRGRGNRSARLPLIHAPKSE